MKANARGDARVYLFSISDWEKKSSPLLSKRSSCSQTGASPWDAVRDMIAEMGKLRELHTSSWPYRREQYLVHLYGYFYGLSYFFSTFPCFWKIAPCLITGVLLPHRNCKTNLKWRDLEMKWSFIGVNYIADLCVNSWFVDALHIAVFPQGENL